MNILFVADVSIHKVIGGAERVLFEQSARLASKGHNVYILTRKLPLHTSDYENIQNVHEWRYSVDRSNDLSFLLSSISQCQKLFNTISNNISFDIINFHQPFSALAVNLLKKSHHIPKVYTCHSLSFEEYETRNKLSAKASPFFFRVNSFLRKRVEKFSLSKCKKIVVLSQFTKDKLILSHQIPAPSIEIIPGAADTEFFIPALSKQEIKSGLSIPEHKFLLFTVRNLVPRMGLENLIKAMAIICKENDDIDLMIGGDGILKNELTRMIEEMSLNKRVILCGYLSKEKLLKHFQAADLFILPTIALEGFGLVTVESLACGTPVLGTPIGGTKEILNAFDQSFLFNDTSPESIAELIIKKYKTFKNDPNQYTTLSNKCRTFAQEHYSWPRNINHFERVLTQCAGSAVN